MDLMGPMQVESIGRKMYVLVCVDYFSRYTWVEFLREKTDAFEKFRALCISLEHEKELFIKRVRTDHGREFENEDFEFFCSEKGIQHEFSAPKTPQQNGVVERKNRTLQEMTRTMLNSHNTPLHFWAEAMNTACYIINRVYLKPKTHQTAYEIWRGKKPSLKHLHVFGSTCYVLNDREQRRKLDDKGVEAIFLGYSSNSRAFSVFNKSSGTIIESINVTFEDITHVNEEDEVPASVHSGVPANQNSTESTNEDSNDTSESDEDNAPRTNKKVAKDHPTTNVIGDVEETRRTRGKKIDFLQMVSHIAFTCYISNI